jgi:hypothetical protein
MASKKQLDRALGGYAVAAERGRAARARGDLAASARYETKQGRIHVELVSGSAVAVPVDRLQGLGNATPLQLRKVTVIGRGRVLHWPDLDIDISVPDLIAGSLGTRAWMRQMGKHGGRRSSPAKAAAARENGKRGGRPRKVQSRSLV